MKEESLNTDIGDIERSLFEKVLKARLSAAVEAVASKTSPPTREKTKKQASAKLTLT